jgi:3-hydroxyanthranilate 3,4-dioxygenase
MMQSINFKRWIDENRDKLKPPVGNQQIWLDREFMVTVVGGPNARADFHINEGEEFFYQVEGNINLRVIENGKPRDLPIGEGEIFLLPPRVPHSPQRPAGTVGLVIERRRMPGELDGFQWFCAKCETKVGELAELTKLYEEFIPLTDIVKDLPPLFDRFYGDPKHCTCPRCGHVTRKGDRPA